MCTLPSSSCATFTRSCGVVERAGTTLAHAESSAYHRGFPPRRRARRTGTCETAGLSSVRGDDVARRASQIGVPATVAWRSTRRRDASDTPSTSASGRIATGAVDVIGDGSPRAVVGPARGLVVGSSARPSTYTGSRLPRPGWRRPADRRSRRAASDEQHDRGPDVEPQPEHVVELDGVDPQHLDPAAAERCRPSRRARTPGRSRAGTGGRPRPARRRPPRFQRHS